MRAVIGASGQDTTGADRGVPHGQWLPWLDAEFGWSDRTARSYMQVAEAFKSETLSDFSGVTIDATALYALSAPDVPQAARRIANPPPRGRKSRFYASFGME